MTTLHTELGIMKETKAKRENPEKRLQIDYSLLLPFFPLDT